MVEFGKTGRRGRCLKGVPDLRNVGGYCGKRGDDFFWLRETPFFVFGKNDLSIDEHIELAFAPGFANRLVPKRLLDMGRETRSLGFIVSHHAIFDLNLHVFPLVCG